MGKIDIIIPVYNVEKNLPLCIESILCQTFKDFTLILVDDGSTDSCGVICDNYAFSDPRIVVLHQKNSGVSAARNAGIQYSFEHSKSEWITFVDGDDWVNTHYIEALYDAVLDIEADVGVCGFCEQYSIPRCVDASDLNSKVTQVVSFEEYYCTKWKYINIIVSWGKIYRKKGFLETRFPEGKINEDIFTTYKLLFASMRIAVIDQPLYSYYVGSVKSIMRASWTPKRLAEIEGYEEMISFMETHNFEQAQRKMIDTYFWSLDRQIKMLQAPEAVEYEEYRTQLVKKLSDAIKKYRKMVPVTLRERHWLIEDVHPNMMKVYWKVHAILSGRS